MKSLMAAILVLGSASAFAEHNGKPAGYGPDYNGPVVAGPMYSSSPISGQTGHAAGYGPDYTGCIDGTVATVVSPGARYGKENLTVIGQVVCENNQWVNVQ